MSRDRQSRREVTGGFGEGLGKRSYCLMGTRVSEWEDRKFRKWMAVMVTQQCDYS